MIVLFTPTPYPVYKIPFHPGPNTQSISSKSRVALKEIHKYLCHCIAVDIPLRGEDLKPSRDTSRATREGIQPLTMFELFRGAVFCVTDS